MMMEEYGYVLDFMPEGRHSEGLREPIAYVIGESYFTPLEVSIKPDLDIKLESRIVVGRDDREQVLRIKRRVGYDDLTSTARNTLERIISVIVEKNEQKFVEFVNKCGPITMRQHQIELLPGIGKKHMREILDERDIKPFENFEDMKERLTLFPDPLQMFSHRILMELKGEDKYFLFVKPYHKQ